MDIEKLKRLKYEYGYFKLIDMDMGSLRIKFCNKYMRMISRFVDYGDDGLIGLIKMYLALKNRTPYDVVAYDGSQFYWVFQIKDYHRVRSFGGSPFDTVVFSLQSSYWHISIEQGAFFYQEFPVDYLEYLFEKLFKDILKHPNFPEGFMYVYEDDKKFCETYRKMLSDLQIPEGWSHRRLEDIPALVETRKEMFDRIQ